MCFKIFIVIIFMINPNRIRLLQDGTKKSGPVLYWMSRDQRIHDNWALLFALHLAKETGKGLITAFALQPDFLEAAYRQYGFMLKGLMKLEPEFERLNIPFTILLGKPEEVIPVFVNDNNISAIVSDFDPLKIKRIWKREVAKNINIPFYEVDAHNIVPCLFASQKEEYGAYTLRPKIHRLLPDFLDEFPKPEALNITPNVKIKQNDWNSIENSLNIDFSVKEIEEFTPGEEGANEMLDNFLKNKLDNYENGRNNPVLDAQSNLSPYLHFGQLSAQRIALNIRKYFPVSASSEAFLEELIVRRELADNFCYYNTKYDSFEGFKDWAKESLNKHRTDKREFVYSLEQFEQALTHEDLWNAAQKELLNKGKMHGYMRMYWAKKILEWSETPEEALKTAIYLNDKYSLDGRDPNGYTGCAWSIGGIHDRAWTERPVFGKIRYMNYNGCKRKFDVEEYIKSNSKFL